MKTLNLRNTILCLLAAYCPNSFAGTSLKNFTMATTKLQPTVGKINLGLKNEKLRSAENLRYAVNMQDGGLILKEESDSLLNVTRTYRSRSLDHGFFGIGWCTDLESELIFQGQGVIRLVNCQSARPRLFHVNKTASAYINDENPLDQITIKLGFYERQIQNNWVAKYNFKGRLIELNHNGETIKLMYNSRGLPDKVLTNEKLLTFKWHPLLDLIEQVNWGSQSEKFEYQGFNLIKVSKGQIQSLRYEYDDLDNLISRKISNEATALEITYNKAEDQVLQIQGACHEIYSYKKMSSKKIVSTVSKSCQKQSSKKEFSFEYAENSSSPKQITVSDVPLTPVERLALNQIQSPGESL